LIIREKSSGQVSLRIQVNSQDPDPKLSEHPGKVVHQGRFAHAAFVVKKRDDGDTHILLMTAST
jgi:hypothetical protein